MQKEIFDISLTEFFKLADELFKKEIAEEEEQSENNKQYKYLKNEILPKVEIFLKKKKMI